MAAEELDPKLSAVRDAFREQALHVVPPSNTEATGTVRQSSVTTTGVPSRSTFVYQMASSVSLAPPVFIWDNWIERRTFTILAGRQGAGKTTWASHIVALLTTGKNLPDDTEQREPMQVAWLSFEETAGRIAARLKAAGADLDQIFILGSVHVDEAGIPLAHQWRMPRDIGVLEDFIKEHKIDLTIIDGVGYSIDGGGSDPGYTVVSSVLSELNAVMDRTDSSVLGLTHISKSGGEAATAAIGSTAWTALARISWVLGFDKDDETKHIVTVGKTNHEYPATGYEFNIIGDEELRTGVVSNIQASTVSKDEVTSGWKNDEDRGSKADAKEFLLEVLGDGKERPSLDLFKDAEEQGINKTALNRAKKTLGIRPTKLPGKDGPWVWRLVDEMCPPSPARTLIRDGRDGYLEDSHGVPLTPFRGSSEHLANLPSDLGFHAEIDPSQVEGGQGSESDHLPNLTPLNIIVRDDIDPSDLVGLPKMAMGRYRSGNPLTLGDKTALVLGGFATWTEA